MTTKSSSSASAHTSTVVKPSVATAIRGKSDTTLRVIVPQPEKPNGEKKEPVPAQSVTPAVLSASAKSEMTLGERIQRVENLQLIVNKRAKLVQTRNELEKFQTASNDFNCQMQLKDSDGNASPPASPLASRRSLSF